MSSGGISSRLSGSVLSGSDDGSKIRCAFHGDANSPLAHGMACAFADDPRPSRIAATGPGNRSKRPYPLREREGGEHVTGEAGRSENDRRLRIRTAGLILVYAGARFWNCEIEVMRSPATRLAGKSFPRVAKYFASQNAVTTTQHKRGHPLVRGMYLIWSSATLEVAFRNPNVVARKNRNRRIEREGLFRAGA